MRRSFCMTPVRSSSSVFRESHTGWKSLARGTAEYAAVLARSSSAVENMRSFAFMRASVFF